ncbi:undecaprenyl-diphosphatase [Peribacillus saganii]|uniref:Undecaprenyl-diphosphatase n=1 Tax=Peribacillus saganii TaxID=2303992 RepID=A0A372LTS7_9BACI|nr:undecaprenyl-diphosphatase [Peribacillus saganii]RFU71212.1 undecaprenyl-diphosphatase [Peribacillus saganii]
MNFTDVNVSMFRLINDLGKQHEYLNPVIVFLAEYMVYFLGVALLISWFSRTNRNRLMVINAVLALIIAEIAGKIAGQFYSNYQPFAELENVNLLIEKSVGNSFPSDHAILFFSVCFSFWLFRKKEGCLLLLLAILVAFSRIYVGVHYPADVAAGALLGVLSALLAFWIIPRLSFSKSFAVANPEKEKSKTF